MRLLLCEIIDNRDVSVTYGEMYASENANAPYNPLMLAPQCAAFP